MRGTLGRAAARCGPRNADAPVLCCASRRPSWAVSCCYRQAPTPCGLLPQQHSLCGHARACFQSCAHSHWPWPAEPAGPASRLPCPQRSGRMSLLRAHGVLSLRRPAPPSARLPLAVGTQLLAWARFAAQILALGWAGPSFFVSTKVLCPPSDTPTRNTGGLGRQQGLPSAPPGREGAAPGVLWR